VVQMPFRGEKSGARMSATKKQMRRGRRLTSGLTCGLLAVLVAVAVRAQRPGPPVVAEYGGDPIYQVLPAGQIPAITEPSYVSAEDADAQMLDHEPVIGVVIDGKARAYSLWQLDAHEIVNDRMGGSAFAATW
jgi:hypothetical protein